MGFDVLEFHERAGRVEAEQGGYPPGPEAISCVFDGIDLESADPGGDPRTLLGDSRVSIEPTNGFADVCNLYISAYPVDGRLHIHSRIDASVEGAKDSPGLVTLIEAILVHASITGDLAFAAAEELAADPWRPGERWACSDGVWVDLDFLAGRLDD